MQALKPYITQDSSSVAEMPWNRPAQSFLFDKKKGLHSVTKKVFATTFSVPVLLSAVHVFLNLPHCGNLARLLERQIRYCQQE